MKTLGLLLFCVCSAFAVPQLINYQGQLTRPDGTPLDTTVAMTFKLYTDSMADPQDTLLWTEARPSVTTVGGLFHVRLGELTALPDSVLSHPQVWLGVRVGVDYFEMTPRMRLTSVPYAHRIGTVDGASGGTVTGDFVVLGQAIFGTGNRIIGPSGFVAGSDNAVLEAYGTVVGGHDNTVGDTAGTVSGGIGNTVYRFSVVGGGGSNTASDTSVVSGGFGNLAEYTGFIGGGVSNSAIGRYSVIAGGESNLIGVNPNPQGHHSAIGGGVDNEISSDQSVISGGRQNKISGVNGTIGGGYGNEVSGPSGAVVGGGVFNRARGYNSVVSGGGGSLADSNSARGDASAIPGGRRNETGGTTALAAGYRAKATHHGTFVWADSTAADFASTAQDQFLIRAGGGVGIGTTSPTEQFEINGDARMDTLVLDAAIRFPDGTIQNTSSDSAFSQQDVDTLSWDATRGWVQSLGYLRGDSNSVSATGFVGGGSYNRATGLNSAIVGGGGHTLTKNEASGSKSIVLAGSSNTSSGGSSAVLGGAINTASGVNSVVIGGNNCQATGDNSVVGGRYNSARGNYSVAFGGGPAFGSDSNSARGASSVIPGGSRNETSATLSFAAGHRAKALHSGAFVWADSTSSDFASSASNQFLIRAGGGVGIGLTNPAEQLEVNGDVKADTFRVDAAVRFPDGTTQTSAPPSLALYQQDGDTSTFDATRTWVTANSQQDTDTSAWDATRSWVNTAIAQYQQDADSNSWDATRTWVQSMGYLKGSNNMASSTGFVGGGNNNKARGSYSVVAGGGGATPSDSNAALGTGSTVSGGQINVASGQFSVVAGGYQNTASGSQSSVLGGSTNLASATGAAIWGGNANEASGNYSAAAGYRAKAQHAGTLVWADSAASDFGSTAQDQFLIRAGGGVGIGLNNPAEQLEVAGDIKADTIRVDNAIRFADGTIQTTAGSLSAYQLDSDTSTWDATRTWVQSMGYLKGSSNVVSSTGFVGGGNNNKARGSYSVVAGGGGTTASDSNSARGNYSVIGGGSDNTADSAWTVVAGGRANFTRDLYAAVSGGQTNEAFGRHSTVSGGQTNSAGNDHCTVSGGANNAAYGNYASIAGGRYNHTAGEGAAIGGGGYNEARGAYSVVGGGGGSSADSNSAGADYSAIVGGSRNEISSGATYSVIVGGLGNYAYRNYSLVAGRYARAEDGGSFVWSSGGDTTESFGANTFTARASGGVRFYTNASSTTIGASLSAGSGTWASLSDSTMKRNRRSVDTGELLRKVTELPIQQWSYESQDAGIEHVGPMAQDFWRLFHVGDDSLTISTIDPSGVALAAIQELAKENQELHATNDKLQATNDKQDAELCELRVLVQSLLADRQEAKLTDKE